LGAFSSNFEAIGGTGECLLMSMRLIFSFAESSIRFPTIMSTFLLGLKGVQSLPWEPLSDYISGEISLE
jgi:hypothetical protein